MSSKLLQGCSAITFMITHTLYFLYFLYLLCKFYFSKELLSISKTRRFIEGLSKNLHLIDIQIPSVCKSVTKDVFPSFCKQSRCLSKISPLKQKQLTFMFSSQKWKLYTGGLSYLHHTHGNL